MYYYSITYAELPRYLQRKGAVLIDIRDREDFLLGHIPGAINIPYEELPSYCERHPVSGPILLYCDRGNQSLISARDLQKKGISAFSIYGGFAAYRGKVIS